MRLVSEQYCQGQNYAYLQLSSSVCTGMYCTHAYYIDFDRLTQSKVESGYTRSIRWEDSNGTKGEPAVLIEQDIQAVVQAMDAAAVAEVSGAPHRLPEGTSQELVAQFNSRVAHARRAFASCAPMFAELAPNTPEFAAVSLKLSTNMQRHIDIEKKMAGASLLCIHQVSLQHSKAPLRPKMFKMQLDEEAKPALEAWHGASLDAIINIVQGGGFAVAPTKNAKLFGNGVYLAPLTKAWMSCDERYATKDPYGIQHVLLCDFVQGTPEQIAEDSTQAWPTPGSDRHTGVDRLSNPGRYIVWSTDMNQRILPKFVISFELG